MIVRPFATRDAPTVAELHRMSLPRGFLSTLGDRFLGRLYQLLAEAERTCVWVGADHDDRCVGFVSGSLDIRASYSQVLRRGGLGLTAAVAPRLLRPSVLGRVFQTMAYPLRQGGGGHTGVDPASIRAELLSIGVSGAARGHGLGRCLVASLEESFRDWGHRGPYRVVTDAEDPRSNAFYTALEFRLAGEFLHHDHRMSLYIKELPPAGAAGEGAS